jgi:hypothetical protein
VVGRAGGRPLKFATTPSIATASPSRSRLTATERCPLRKQNEDRTSAAETPSPPHGTARLKIRGVVPPSRDGPAARWFEYSVRDERIGLPDPGRGVSQATHSQARCSPRRWSATCGSPPASRTSAPAQRICAGVERKTPKFLGEEALVDLLGRRRSRIRFSNLSRLKHEPQS